MAIGRKIVHLNSVDSTSNYVANMVNRGEIVSGTVILADEQYDGRGQRGAKWSVKPGENLTFSFYIDNVNMSVDEQFILTQLVSLAIYDVLTGHGMDVCVKWPNDIFVNDKKIAGVLIENHISGQLIKSSVIGIGLNVNQEAFDDFPATSVVNETGQHVLPKELLFSFIAAFNKRWDQRSQKETINSDYLEHLYLLDVPAHFEDARGAFEGAIQGIASDGQLIVDRAGELQHYRLKEITFKH